LYVSVAAIKTMEVPLVPKRLNVSTAKVITCLPPRIALCGSMRKKFEKGSERKISVFLKPGNWSVPLPPLERDAMSN